MDIYIFTPALVRSFQASFFTPAGEAGSLSTTRWLMLIVGGGGRSAIEFLSTCKVANLTVRAELGCCFLHRSGRLTVEGCVLQCEENPLDFLSFPIVSTAAPAAARERGGDRVTVAETRIEGGAKAVLSCGTLTLQHVRAIYAPKAIFFWFEAVEK